MTDQLLKLLAQKAYVPSNVPELLQLLRLPPARQQELQKALRELEHAGRVARIKGNRYILPLAADLIPGRIRMNRQGKGFLQPDDPTLKEIAIPESATGTALHEDHVLVRRDGPLLVTRPGEEVQPTGTVIRVLERHRTQIVGTLQRSPQFLYVIPDDPRIPHDIYVPEPRDVGRKALVGDKVVVELRAWESRHTNPEGEVVEVLGAADAEGVDMLSVLRQYNLPRQFPKKVLDEARAYGTEVQPGDLAGREDCRRHQVVTIDPDDAKDFDDAICLEQAPGNQWRLWVHIADVSHYVKPGMALDEEAAKRGNSTYLVDRVIPMLPEALSSELCSLKPNVDRLTKCVEFLISTEGRVLKTRCFPAVIHSQRRFTYREAFEALNRPPTTPIERMLHQANELAQRIRRLRFDAGALELDFPEMKIRLDEKGRVLRIEKVENDVSHQLIEEFMLLANEAVAARLIRLKRPAIHRVHEEPDARRLLEYQELVQSHRVPVGKLSTRGEIQKLLRTLGTIPIGPALKIGFLKSLKRARYAVDPLGHYGLAKNHYAHFTSPIRRYADLVVHRALFEERAGPKNTLQQTADHISNTERNSADAERDSKDVKLYAHLESQLKAGKPEKYPALVTDLRNFGFFVDVTTLGMSGLVPFSEMQDDFYEFDPQRQQVLGRRSRRIIKLGDRLDVQVAKVNRFKKQVDFRLAQGALAPGGRYTRSQAPASSRREADFRTGGDRRPAAPRQDRGRPPERQGSARPQPSRPAGKPSASNRPPTPVLSHKMAPNRSPADRQASNSRQVSDQRTSNRPGQVARPAAPDRTLRSSHSSRSVPIGTSGSGNRPTSPRSNAPRPGTPRPAHRQNPPPRVSAPSSASVQMIRPGSESHGLNFRPSSPAKMKTSVRPPLPRASTSSRPGPRR